MARQSSITIFVKDARGKVEEARKRCNNLKCALTRANAELRTAEVAFKREQYAVRGVPIEDYPDSYKAAEKRRFAAFIKYIDADDAYWECYEALEAARANERDISESAARNAERQYALAPAPNYS